MRSHKLKFSLFLLAVVISCSGFAAQKDSLLRVLDKGDLSTVDRVRALIDLSKQLSNSNPDSALDLSSKAYRLANSDLHDTTQAKAAIRLGEEFRYRSQLDTATSLFKTAKNLFHQQGNKKGEGHAMIQMGFVMDSKGDFKESRRLYKKTLRLYKEIGFTKGIAIVYNNLGNNYFYQNRYDTAISYYNKTLDLLEGSKKANTTLSKAYNNLGIIFDNLSNYPKALDYYFKSLSIKRKIGDSRGISNTYNNIGGIYYRQKERQKAMEYFKKSLQLDEKLQDYAGSASTLNNIANIHYIQHDFIKAINNLRKSIKINPGNDRVLSTSYQSLGTIYLGIIDEKNDKLPIKLPSIKREKGEKEYTRAALLDSAEWYLRKSMEIQEAKKDNYSLAYSYSSLARIANLNDKINKALRLRQKALELAHHSGNMDLETKVLESLASNYNQIGDHKKAYQHHVRYRALKDSVYNEKKSKEMGSLETRHEYEKKLLKEQKEKEKNKALAKEREERQNLTLAAVSAGLGLVILFSIFLFNRFRITRKQKGIIEEQKQEVDYAFNQLTEKNREITDSIQYASRIQQAILTSAKKREHALGDHFIFFRPKDVVSGDFYWVHHDEAKSLTFWVAADCTGHGVPGAFMSMIGNRLFNEIIVEQKETDPGHILDKVREGVISALGQSGAEDRKDGMDAALCILDRKKMELRFAGANNGLYVVGGANSEKGEEPPITNSRNLRKTSDPEENPNYRNLKKAPEPEESPNFLEIKPDKQPIGQPDGPMKPFTTQTITVRPGDTLYTFSDGFADQFGGPKGKKYRYKPFKRLLLSIKDEPMEQQKKLLEKEFDGWKREKEQLDDVVVVGVNI